MANLFLKHLNKLRTPKNESVIDAYVKAFMLCEATESLGAVNVEAQSIITTLGAECSDDAIKEVTPKLSSIMSLPKEEINNYVTAIDAIGNSDEALKDTCDAVKQVLSASYSINELVSASLDDNRIKEYRIMFDNITADMYDTASDILTSIVEERCTDAAAKTTADTAVANAQVQPESSKLVNSFIAFTSAEPKTSAEFILKNIWTGDVDTTLATLKTDLEKKSNTTDISAMPFDIKKAYGIVLVLQTIRNSMDDIENIRNINTEIKEMTIADPHYAVVDDDPKLVSRSQSEENVINALKTLVTDGVPMASFERVANAFAAQRNMYAGIVTKLDKRINAMGRAEQTAATRRQKSSLLKDKYDANTTQDTYIQYVSLLEKATNSFGRNDDANYQRTNADDYETKRAALADMEIRNANEIRNINGAMERVRTLIGTPGKDLNGKLYNLHKKDPSVVNVEDVVREIEDYELDANGNPVIGEDGNPVRKMVRKVVRDDAGNTVKDADGNWVTELVPSVTKHKFKVISHPIEGGTETFEIDMLNNTMKVYNDLPETQEEIKDVYTLPELNELNRSGEYGLVSTDMGANNHYKEQIGTTGSGQKKMGLNSMTLRHTAYNPLTVFDAISNATDTLDKMSSFETVDECLKSYGAGRVSRCGKPATYGTYTCAPLSDEEIMAQLKAKMPGKSESALKKYMQQLKQYYVSYRTFLPCKNSGRVHAQLTAAKNYTKNETTSDIMLTLPTMLLNGIVKNGLDKQISINGDVGTETITFKNVKGNPITTFDINVDFKTGNVSLNQDGQPFDEHVDSGLFISRNNVHQIDVSNLMQTMVNAAICKMKGVEYTGTADKSANLALHQKTIGVKKLGK